MKKLFTLFLAMAAVSFVLAQDSTLVPKKKKKDWSQINLSNRANDHFLIQLGYNGWANKLDTIQTRGLSRSFNMYFMYDFPFKSNPRFSVGLGVGVGTDNMYFKKTYIDITGRQNPKLTFNNVSDTNYFKKYKLATAYLEIPAELRFSANPEVPNKSWKIALGGKVGFLVSAATKGKTLQNKSGTTLNAYTEKEKARRYFNGTRLSVGGRISYGVFGIYGSYQINNFIKEGSDGSDIRPFQIGLSISGL
jgi:hypothetical protein